jgi:hypothetical protein
MARRWTRDAAGDDDEWTPISVPRQKKKKIANIFPRLANANAHSTPSHPPPLSLQEILHLV